MSEFEKELDGILEIIKDEKFYNSKLYALPSIEELKAHFKDWQPPKTLVEVPQCVADWFEDSMEGTFAGVISSYAFNDIEAVKWVQGNGGIDLLCRMKLDGYTVEKEQLYVLKHIDMSKFSENSSLYLSRSIKSEIFGKYDHMRVPDGVDVSEIEQCHFTQSEIDELNIGSYEQIPVEMSDNGI